MRNKNITILFFMMVVMMLGFGIIIPIMPFYIEHFNAGGTTMGLLMAVFSIAQFILSPVWGGLSDRYGRKPIILIGVAGNALSMVMNGLAPNIETLFASRILGGIFSAATMPTAMAFIGDSTEAKDRGSGMGVIGAAMGMGMVLGPGIGGWLGGQSISMPFFVAAGLSTFSMLLIWLFLPESLPKAKRVLGQAIRGPQLKDMWQALFGPLGFLLFLSFLMNFGLASFEGVFGLYTRKRYSYTAEQIGTIMTVIGLISTIIQGALSGLLTKRLGEVNLIKISLLTCGIGSFFLLWPENFAGVMVAVAFFTVTNAMLRPASSSLISMRAEGGQGSAMGLNNAFQSLGRMVGPMWAGWLLDVHLELPYISMGLVMLLSFVFSMFWLSNRPSVKTGIPVKAD